MIETITLLGGSGKNGAAEPVDRVEFAMGDVVSIVGPTGSGKTTLINDIELFADGSTPSKRRILINGEPPAREYGYETFHNPIALITQHTNFLSDLPVGEFLSIHAAARRTDDGGAGRKVDETLHFANELTGEPIGRACRMTELSGGQTRALLIADAVVIGNTPIVLLDEIENAGIHRMRALELLRMHRKIYIFVTHDPYIALLSDFRIVMQNGRMVNVVRLSEEERKLQAHVRAMDDRLSGLRNRIRAGESLNWEELAVPA